MGFAISWLAVRSEADSVLAALGLEKTGETGEFAESDWCSTRVGEWTVVWSNSFEPAKFRDAPLRFKEIIVCDVEEHVMFVCAAAFNDGTRRWRIVHDAQKSHDHLVVEGQPPESFVRIKAEEFARMDSDHDVDFVFEIPVRVAKDIVGFRHDDDSGTVFDVLRDTLPTKPKWKFW